jgi:hypothetical protein
MSVHSVERSLMDSETTSHLESSQSVDSANDAKTSPSTTSSQRIELGLKWLQDTYGDEWFMEIDLKKGFDMNSSNLHLITYVSGKDYNLWMLDGFQEFMYEHGFSTGEEIIQNVVTKEYELTDSQEELQSAWYGLVFALQVQRGDQSGDSSEQEKDTQTETRSVLCGGRTLLEDGGGRAEGNSSDQHGVTSPPELCETPVQRSGTEERTPDSQTGERISEQLSLF